MKIITIIMEHEYKWGTLGWKSAGRKLGERRGYMGLRRIEVYYRLCEDNENPPN
jgi:hypothetical protein